MYIYTHTYTSSCIYVSTCMAIWVYVSMEGHTRSYEFLYKKKTNGWERAENKYSLLFILLLCILNSGPVTCSTLSINLLSNQ